MNNYNKTKRVEKACVEALLMMKSRKPSEKKQVCFICATRNDVSPKLIDMIINDQRISDSSYLAIIQKNSNVEIPD